MKAIEEICKKHKVTLRQAAIQFALGHPAVVSVVLGAVKPEEVKANVHDATVEIPASLWSDLKSAKLLDFGRADEGIGAARAARRCEAPGARSLAKAG